MRSGRALTAACAASRSAGGMVRTARDRRPVDESSATRVAASGPGRSRRRRSAGSPDGTGRRRRGAEQGADAHGPGRLTEHGDVAGVAAERRRCSPGPTGARRSGRAGRRCPSPRSRGEALEVEEAEGAEPVVERDDDDVAAGQVRAVVPGHVDRSRTGRRHRGSTPSPAAGRRRRPASRRSAGGSPRPRSPGPPEQRSSPDGACGAAGPKEVASRGIGPRMRSGAGGAKPEGRRRAAPRTGCRGTRRGRSWRTPRRSRAPAMVGTGFVSRCGDGAAPSGRGGPTSSPATLPPRRCSVTSSTCP